MTAQIGADDLQFFQEPRPTLLRRVSGIEPEPRGLHVLLDTHGVKSTQRLTLSGFDGGLVASLWPAELKTQAAYLYGQHLGSPMISRARELGWTAEGAPQLAFRNSAPAQRLYMKPAIDALEYALNWEGSDFLRVGQHSRAELARSVWPWLKTRGYADDRDDAVLREFIETQLGNRPAYLRPALRLRRRWYSAAGNSIADEIRAEANSILAAAREPSLPS